MSLKKTGFRVTMMLRNGVISVKKLFMAALCVLLCCLSGCGTVSVGLIQTKEDLKPATGPFSRTIEFTVSDTPNKDVISGLGAEWDPHFFMSYNQDKGCDEQDWALICERAKMLGIQKIRVWCIPLWFEPEKDVYTFESDKMASLTRVLDAAEELGIDVNITLWGCQGWLAMDNDYWISPPNDLTAYAEGVSELTRWLLDTKQYTCVKELTFHNEPDWEYKCDDTVSDPTEYYFEMCRTVDATLRADGLRDRIRLSLPGVSFSAASKFAAGLGDIADSFDIHCYNFGAESLFPEITSNVEKLKEELTAAGIGDMPITVSEFGGNKQIDAYHQEDTDSYDRGVYYSTIVEAFLSEGVSSMLHWCFFDQYYNGSGDEQNSRMMLGLFSYKDDNWEPRPFYHSWGLITKYAVKGSEIYPFTTNSKYVNGVALKSPDGKWTYLITCQQKGKDTVVKINNPHLTEPQMNVHEYKPENITTGDELIGSSGIAYSEGGTVYVLARKNTFTLLTEMDN